MTQEIGQMSIHSENIFPILKRWLYTDREIFIRELVSNGVDAITKYKRLVSLGEAPEDGEDYEVTVVVDRQKGALIFSDNGIGMTADEVRRYDERMAAFRNIPAETDAILAALNLKSTHTVIEFGAGTGETAIELSKHCAHVYAVDVSKTMCDYAKNKAKARMRNNIEFIHSGFLSYEHGGAPVDAVVSQIALHHLGHEGPLLFAVQRRHLDAAGDAVARRLADGGQRALNAVKNGFDEAGPQFDRQRLAGGHHRLPRAQARGFLVDLDGGHIAA